MSNSSIVFEARPIETQDHLQAQRWIAKRANGGAKEEDQEVSFGQVFEILASPSDPQGQDLRTKLVEAIQASPWSACFWECPSITPQTLHQRRFEFVLVEALELAAVTHSPGGSAFDEYLGSGKGLAEVRSFANLGKDADLVSPTQAQDVPLYHYTHLTAFLLGSAPLSQKCLLWQKTAEVALQRLKRKSQRVWISTSGLGVYYLHIRIEDRPKYYTWMEYITGRY